MLRLIASCKMNGVIFCFQSIFLPDLRMSVEILLGFRLGNAAFAAKEYDEAIKYYTAAIAIDSKNCVYYSNRR